MSSIDDRIVRMEFNNAQFKKGAAETVKSLEDVNKAVDDTGSNRGLMDLDKEMNVIAASASKMSIITTTALATVTAKLTSGFLGVGKNILQTMIAGGKARAIAIEQAKFQFRGLGMNVEKTMAQALYAVDGTAYGLQEAASAAAQFGGSGVKMGKDMKHALRSISGLASQTGRSYGEIAGVMTGISGVGRVTSQDLIQFGVRGLNVASSMAKAWGTTEAQVRKMVSEGKISFKEFAKVMDETFGKNATKANDTYTGALANLNAVYSRFGAGFQESKLEAQRRIFVALIPILKGVTKGLEPIRDAFSKKVLEGADKLALAISKIDPKRLVSAFKPLGRAITNVIAPFKSLATVITGSFLKVFMPKSGLVDGIEKTTSAVEWLTKPFASLAKVIEKAAPWVEFFFRLIKMGAQTIVRVGSQFADFVLSLGMFKNLSAPSGGFFTWLKDFPGKITKNIAKINELLAAGYTLRDAFAEIDIKLPKFPSLSGVGDTIKSWFGGNDPKEIETGYNLIGDSILSLTGNVEGLNKAKKGDGGVFNPDAKLDTSQVTTPGAPGYLPGSETSTGDVKKRGESLIETVKTILTKLKTLFTSEDIIGAMNFAVLATIGLNLGKMMEKITAAIPGGTFNKALTEFTAHLGTAADALKKMAVAKIIMSLAISLGILALSIWLLSKVPAGKAWNSLALLVVGLAALTGSIVAISYALKKFDKAGMGVQMLQISISIAVFALAMVLLAVAMKKMEDVDPGSMVKVGVSLLVIIGLFTLLGKFSKDADSIIMAGLSLLAISVSLLIMAKAFKAFEGVKPSAMGKAAAAMAIATLALGALLAVVIITGGAGAAVIIAVAASMVAVGYSIKLLGEALILFNKVKTSSIVKLTVVLAILAVMTTLMTAGVAGALAMPVLAFGLTLLAGALKLFEFVKFEAIFMMTAAMVGLALGLIILAPALMLVSPPLMLFSVAIMLLVAAFWLFTQAVSALGPALAVGGAAIIAFAATLAIAIGVFFQTLALQAKVIRASMVTILKEFFKGLIEAVPTIIAGVRTLYNAVAKELTGEEPQKLMGDSGKTWMERINDAINDAIPLIVETTLNLISVLLKGIAKRANSFGTVGGVIIARFINGIEDSLNLVLDAGVSLIIAVIRGIQARQNAIIDAAASAVIAFINGVATTLRERSEELVTAFTNLGVAIIVGFGAGIRAQLRRLNPVSLIRNMVGDSLGAGEEEAEVNSPSKRMIRLGEAIVKGLTIGVQNHAAAAIVAVASMVSGQIATASAYVSKFVQDLDQKSIAARAQAEGLAAAAARANHYAKKTKTKKDDKAAARIEARASAADKAAARAEAIANREKERLERKETFDKASLLDKAKMRSEDAQGEIDTAKLTQKNAQAALVQAIAMEKQAKAKGVTKKQRKQLLAEAKAARKRAGSLASTSNAWLDRAKLSAADALRYQQLAGEEASTNYQKMYEDQAKADADEDAFNKMSDKEKADKRREQAEELRKQSEENLAAAKKLAFTDLEAANNLAELALDQADKARDYVREADNLSSSGSQGLGKGSGTVVSLDPTEATAIAMGEYADLYLASTAAAAASKTVQFNQYNTSPEALSPIDIYRQTNNLVNYASDKITSAA